MISQELVEEFLLLLLLLLLALLILSNFECRLVIGTWLLAFSDLAISVGKLLSSVALPCIDLPTELVLVVPATKIKVFV